MEDVVVYGLLRGGIFAMAAFGFSLVLGVIGIVNFAHGALVVFGETEFGRAIRASSDNREAAQLNGINLSRTFERTMFVAGLWAGLAGGLFVTLSPVAPYMHFAWTVDSFLVIVIGGLGSMVGALLGGLIFGVLSFGASFYAPTIAPAITFGVLLLFLIFRPQGILGMGPTTR